MSDSGIPAENCDKEAATLDELLTKVEDVEVRTEIRNHIDRLRKEQPLGLVFERHNPEPLPLHESVIAERCTVKFLFDPASPTWTVTNITNNTVRLHRTDSSREFTCEANTEDLVVVKPVGTPAYPVFRQVGEVKHGRDKPAHVVINGENLHALEALLQVCKEQVDVMYLDPPYNTGAKDWKYNNHYVDKADRFRHSKWLSFMEQRLLLAKQMLKPTKSALIVTIDEKEYLYLGLLLQQIFPESRIQMISSVINPKGTGRTGEFSRTNEFIFFVWQGNVNLRYINPAPTNNKGLAWYSLRRGNLKSARGASGKNQFFPIYVNQKTNTIHSTGEPLPLHVPRQSAPNKKGCATVWPIRDDGTEMTWGLTRESFHQRLQKGYVRVGKPSPNSPQKYVIQYLMSGAIKDIAQGRAVVTSRAPDGSVEATYRTQQITTPTTQWAKQSHNAEKYGTNLLKELLPGRKFPYPKSLYAVEDALRHFIERNPNALVVDFFAGSGTTAHAVMRLNHQDNGQRRSILVTNNELSPEDQKHLTQQGYRPGDPEWESHGIFEHITTPRIRAAITGKTPEGQPVAGDYKFVDEFPITDGLKENTIFYELKYADDTTCDPQTAFQQISPLLYIQAGAQGPQINTITPQGWAAPHNGRYGILFTTTQATAFVQAVNASKTIQYAFITTNSLTQFDQISAQLTEAQPIRLDESYLTSFPINTHQILAAGGSVIEGGGESRRFR